MNTNTQHTDDERLRGIFDSFHPAQTDTDDFMAALEARLDAVECIRSRQQADRRIMRLAIGAAAVTGLAVGVAATLLMPVASAAIAPVVAAIGTSGSDIAASLASPGTVTTLLWLTAAATATLASYNTYELTATLLRRKALGVRR
ncbi:MAG: hypothetical protein K2L16_01360 [Muribaculaceae bacterium]|nr:hypothetical protein [Muribaculaceae bacterium]